MGPYRIALVDDHEIVARGFAELFSTFDAVSVAMYASTVDELLDAVENRRRFASSTGSRDVRLDLVILDLILADGSDPAANVRRLRAKTGAEVLALVGTDDALLVRSAALAGALGVVRKSDRAAVLRRAVVRAAARKPVATTEWKAALDPDSAQKNAALSSRERQVLSLYASGSKTQRVASMTGLSESTVVDYIRRVRSKYDRVGRPARTKVELYQRAIEDGILPPPTPLRAYSRTALIE